MGWRCDRGSVGSGGTLAAQGVGVLFGPAVGQQPIELPLRPVAGDLVEHVRDIRPRVELVQRARREKRVRPCGGVFPSLRSCLTEITLSDVAKNAARNPYARVAQPLIDGEERTPNPAWPGQPLGAVAIRRSGARKVRSSIEVERSSCAVSQSPARLGLTPGVTGWRVQARRSG